MESTETSLALTSYQKQAIETVATESMIPQSILVRAALLKAARNDPFLRLAAELVALGWREADLDIGQYEDVLQVLLPDDILQTYGILAKLMGVPKVTLYRQAIFAHGPDGIMDVLTEKLRKTIVAEAGIDFISALNGVRSTPGKRDEDINRFLSRVITGQFYPHQNGEAK